MKFFSKFFTKDKKDDLDKGLEKTKNNFWDKVSRALAGKSKVDDEVLDNLEQAMISADIGVDTTLKIIKKLEERVAKEKYLNTSELDVFLREEISSLLTKSTHEIGGYDIPEGISPYVILVVGVNGVGKTTTIGKLAAQFSRQGKKVVLGAGDTFRAAAVDQLKIWGERSQTLVVSKGMGVEPSAVAFEATAKGLEIGADVVIVDTAGRLHNKVNLMNELSKIKKSISKHIPQAPHEVLLVLDGSTGQNALIQAREFTKATDVTALAITKLDGTAKGGVVIAISDEFKIPIKYIGVGEKIDDLQPFDSVEFVNSLFSVQK
jgi:fused signal recognition particle receptor